MSIAAGKAVVQAVIPEELKLWLIQRAKAENRSVSNLTSFLLEQARQSLVEISLSSPSKKDKIQ